MSIRRLSVVVIAAAILLQTGPVATAAVSKKTVDACKLATKTEIEDILGVNLPEPDVDDPARCQYNDNGALITIAVAKYSKALKKDFAVNSKQPGAEKIPGLKKAYAVESARLLRADAVKGKKFLTVVVVAGSGGEVGLPFDQFIEITKAAFKGTLTELEARPTWWTLRPRAAKILWSVAWRRRERGDHMSTPTRFGLLVASAALDPRAAACRGRRSEDQGRLRGVGGRRRERRLRR